MCGFGTKFCNDMHIVYIDMFMQKGQKFGKGLPCGALSCGKDHPLVLRIKPSTMFFGSHTAKFNQLKV